MRKGRGQKETLHPPVHSPEAAAWSSGSAFYALGRGLAAFLCVSSLASDWHSDTGWQHYSCSVTSAAPQRQPELGYFKNSPFLYLRLIL